MQGRYRRLYEAHARLGLHARRIARAEEVVRRALDVMRAPYVGFSGGKDSTALLVLLARMGRTDVPVFTQADDLDWPEKRAFCHATVERLGFGDYTYAESAVSAADQLDQAIEAGDVIRGTFSHVIARYVRDRERDGALLGLRAEEAHGRAMTRRTQGTLSRWRNGLWRAIPIADWTGIDVFAFLISTSTPYMPLYDWDDEHPPHALRMSWLVAPQFLPRGHGVWLRRHDPTRWRALCAAHPALARLG